MDPQEFEEIIHGLQDPELCNQANETLSAFISDPQSILFLFQMIDTPTSQMAKEKSIVFINSYMKKNFDLLESEFKEQILDKLTNLSFTEEPQYSISIYPILCDYIDDSIQRCLNMIQLVDTAISSNTNVVTAMNILSEVIPKFGSNFELLAPSVEILFNYSLAGLQSNDWNLIIPSMRIFFYTKRIGETLTIEPPTIEPHYDIIINLGQDTNLVTDPTLKESFIAYWDIIGRSILEKLIPAEKIGIIYEFVIIFSSNEEISYTYRISPLQSLLGAVGMLNVEQFAKVLDLVFMIAMTYVGSENNIPLDYFSLINKSLTSLPARDVYTMLNERISSLLTMDSREAHVVSIVIYSVIFDIAPDVAFLDIEKIITNLLEALQKEDDLLSEAVCIVLETFHESTHFVDVFALEFLPKIVPFIISPNDDLRLQANLALHTICELISVPVPGFFNALWEIREAIPPTDIEHYIDHLSTAIERTEDFGDNESEVLKEFVLSFLLNLEDVDTGSVFLQLVVTLVNTNETLMEQLLPPSIELAMACFNSPDFVESSIINCLSFISNFYETFGNKYNELLHDTVQVALSLLFSGDNEEEDNNETIRLSIKSAALDACCTVAQATEDPGLAKQLQEKCIYFFTQDYTQIPDNNDEEEDDDIEMVEENELNAIKEGAKSSCAIIKLLDPESAKGLFHNIYLYAVETLNPKCAAEALKPITKFLHCSCDEDKESYLNYCSQILQSIISGEFNCLKGKNILTDQIDFFLMTNIAYLISEVVRYPTPLVESLCEFMIQIISSSSDSAYLYSYIGAYSDVLKYNTGSPQAVQAILELVPNLLSNAKDPDTKQNLTYLLNLLVLNDPNMLPSIVQFIPVLQNWYMQGKEFPNGHQIMLSNIASAFLAFFANGLELNIDLLNEAICEFPPFDTHETAPMIQNMAKIFTSAADKIDISCVQNAALALSKFFLLNEVELKNRKVPPELMQVAHQMFVAFSNSNPDIIQSILEKYQNSQSKLEKLNMILQ